MKKTGKAKPQVNITNNFNAPIGQHIDHVDTINFRMDGDGTFHFNQVDNMAAPPTAAPPVASPTDGLLLTPFAQAMEKVQLLMWGQSAYAVLFCELRDHHHYPNNMSQFEREADMIAARRGWKCRCKAKTMVDAFRRNSFLFHHVDEWTTINAPARARMLQQTFHLACQKDAKH